jgi:DNA-binding beta-propeller fold protein YncE
MDSPTRLHAPDFAAGLAWFNVAAPLSLKALRGKVVLLDFWTYGCINCLHVIPDLKRLEEKYGAELVVVGVHSAKFTNERQGENLRRILVRYDVDHPVVNDERFEIWRSYGARAWPTQVLIDPEGYVVGTASGEGNADAFDRAIAAVVHVFDEQGKIDRTPIALSPERERLTMGTLAFPGKVLADEPSDRLFVADSNHHRVLVCSLDGKILDVAGSGAAGWVDDGFEAARFYRPQGLARSGDTLFVADTENHVVRAIDLAARRVTTIAGTGRQAAWGGVGGAARETSLSSPWDVQLASRLLFVAMAGLHQIWMLDLDQALVMSYAGSGREARVDGPADEAAFAQPSGLSLDRSTLYVADSESNIIRAITLPPVNDVHTLAGGDLFEFGDKDGSGDDVRLQHPLGVAWAAGALYIADTYNHKIKRLDPKTRRVTTFAGTGEAGMADGPAGRARFYEPGGLSATSTSLYVADTNNHAIRRVSLADGSTTTLEIRDRVMIDE